MIRIRIERTDKGQEILLPRTNLMRMIEKVTDETDHLQKKASFFRRMKEKMAKDMAELVKEIKDEN